MQMLLWEGASSNDSVSRLDLINFSVSTDGTENALQSKCTLFELNT